MQELLEKYQAQTVTSPYLFPFLVDEENKRLGKILTKCEMKNARITMLKPVSPTISGS